MMCSIAFYHANTIVDFVDRPCDKNGSPDLDLGESNNTDCQVRIDHAHCVYLNSLSLHPNTMARHNPCLEDNEAALSLCILSQNDHLPPRTVPPSQLASSSPILRFKHGESRTHGIKAPMQNGSVSIEEMVRLMRVYGPIKCIRNRNTKDSGIVKVLSVKRKFYRWFPDFEERFEQTPDGWYRPKCGHEEEMKYRVAMRNKDEVVLAMKRAENRKKNGMKKRNVPQEMVLK